MTRSICACIGVMLVVGIVYYPVLTAGFANHDDQQYALQAAHIRLSADEALIGPSLDWDDIVRVFSHGRIRRPADTGGYYQPLVVLSFMLDGHLTADWHSLAFQFHLTNLLVHLTNTVLVFLLVYQLLSRVASGRARLWAALLSLLFALHPVQVETVAWISQRMTLLGGMFTLLALNGYVRYAQQTQRRDARSQDSSQGPDRTVPGAYPNAHPGSDSRPVRLASYDPAQPVPESLPGRMGRGLRRQRWLAVVTLCYAAAILCRPLFIALPLVLLVLDAWPLRRLARGAPSPRSRGSRLVVEKLPLLAILCLGLGMQFAVNARVLSSPTPTSTSTHLLPSQHSSVLLLSSHTLASLAARLFWPADLSPYHPRSSTAGGMGLGRGFDIAAVLLIATVLLWSFRRRQALFTALAGALIFVVPGLVQVPFSDRLLSDQYLYGALLVPTLALAAWFRTLLVRQGRRTLHRPATLHRSATPLSGWRFFGRRGAGVVGGLALIAVFSFQSHRQSRIWHSSVDVYRHTTRIHPDWAFGYVGLVESYIEEDKLDAALKTAEKAADIAPEDPSTLFYLGTVLLLRHDELNRKAIPLLRAALKADPNWVECLQNLGVALAREGLTQKAIPYLERARDLQPRSAGIRIGLGNAYLKVLRFASARGEFQRALKLRNDSKANLGLAIAWAGNGVPEYALRHLAAAVAKDPRIAAQAVRSPLLRRLRDQPGFDTLIDLSEHAGRPGAAPITESPPARRAHGS